MADKLTQQITDAVARAAAHPDGLPLLTTKSEPGLFPNTTAGKNVSQKCLADGLLTVIGTETKGKAPRERYGLTEAGWDFLLAEVNPKQVLEDFVRVLESRQGEVGELLDTARRMADSLQGLKEAVSRVLPAVSMSRAPDPFGREVISGTESRINGDCTLRDTTPLAELESMILARLADWSGTAGEDCPLPELYRSLSLLDPPPTIGEFHDCLRKLLADGALYLHPWTGPLYAMPEPAYALLAGHNVSYYASPRTRAAGDRKTETDSTRNPNTDS